MPLSWQGARGITRDGSVENAVDSWRRAVNASQMEGPLCGVFFLRSRWKERVKIRDDVAGHFFGDGGA